MLCWLQVPSHPSGQATPAEQGANVTLEELLTYRLTEMP